MWPNPPPPANSIKAQFLLYFRCSGTAGDSLSYHNGMKFSTKDVNNDEMWGGSCAKVWYGAWWFKDCATSHLNSKYLKGSHKKGTKFIYWYRFKGWRYSYKGTEMKVGSSIKLTQGYDNKLLRACSYGPKFSRLARKHFDKFTSEISPSYENSMKSYLAFI